MSRRTLAEPGTALKLEQRGKLFDARVAADAVRPPPLSPQGSRHDAVYFTKEHEWIRVEGDTATVGISNHAQEALGDIVFAEVPEAGRQLTKGAGSRGGRIGEGRVATSMRRSRGEVIEGNPAVADDPALINRDPKARAGSSSSSSTIRASSTG